MTTTNTTTDTTDLDRRSLWRVVARREIAVKLTDKSFVIGSLVTLALIVGLVGIQAWLGGRTETYTIGVTSSASADMVDRIADAAPGIDDSVRVEPERLDSDAEAESATQDESIDAWLRDDADGSWVLMTRDSADTELQRVVSEVVQATALERNAESAGTSLAELTAGSQVELEQLEGDAQLSELRDILGFAMAFLFYLASVMFGMTLAQSVVEEKQSRIVEIIAAAVPLRQLLAGKILGNTVIALGQMVSYVLVGFIALSLTDYGDFISTVSVDVAWFLAFFLVGFLALACLWAVAGALASRNEDLQSTATPVTMLLLAIFLGSAFLEGRWEVIGSFVPPLSVIAMPVRLVDGSAEWWEALISLGLLAGFAALLVVVAERIYRRALMQTGGRLSMREAWRLDE